MSRQSRIETNIHSKTDVTPGNRKLKQKSLCSMQDENAAGVPPIVPEVLHSKGKPLNSATRNTMESYFDRNFSGVRTHTDTKAARSAEAINAQAYSLGQDIVFGEGAYAPNETEAKKLLAHELAHVTQQTAETTAIPTSPESLSVGSAADAAEHTAHQAADKMVAREAGDAITNQASSSPKIPGGLIRRQEIPGSSDILCVSVFAARTMGSLILEGFATDIYDLTVTQQSQIFDLAKTILMLLQQYPLAAISVVGHTDATGSEAHNIRLGQRRADAVQDALAAAGVPTDIIFTSSEGEESLRVETQLAEERNRRVEVIFQPEPPARLDIPPLTLPPSVPESGRLRLPCPPEPQARLDIPPLTLRPPLVPELERSPSNYRPETPERRYDIEWDILHPEELEQPPPQSLNDIFWQSFNNNILGPILNRFGIPEEYHGTIESGVRATIEGGVQGILDLALDSAGIEGEAREAIENLIRALEHEPFIR